MNLTTSTNRQVHGAVKCPGDKSISQRILMIGALMNQEMTVDGFLHAEDPLSTMSALNQIGAGISVDKNGLVHLSKRQEIFQNAEEALNLGNSGTGLRLMMGLTSGMGLNLSFCGDESLSSRPMSRVIKPLTEMGANIEASNGMLPISLSPASFQKQYTYELPVASAQVKSCIMLAGLYAQTETTIIENHQTRNHTEKMFEKFGIEIKEKYENEQKIIKVSPPKKLNPTNIDIPGDFSSASFLIVAGLIIPNSEITIKNVGINSSRTALLKVLSEMGADIQINNVKDDFEKTADILVRTSELKALVLDDDLVPNLIDELPILFIAASFANGKTIIRGAEELRAKESDRLEAMSDSLGNLGVEFKNYRDGIDIFGKGNFKSSVTIDSFGDHRIAMASSIACCMLDGANTIKNVENIQTSFPGFIETCNSLGLKAELLK